MELILAIAAVSAVIFFGALISMGNDRQRRAIDELREQVVLWAVQDLQIKREALSRDVQVDDPLGWLNKITTNVFGSDLHLQVIEVFDEPRALLCMAMGGSKKVIFSLVSPNEILKINRGKRNRLSQDLDRNPFMLLAQCTFTHEISALNSGIFFDLELAVAWAKLTGQDIERAKRLWINMINCD
jgi:hypothetical protein